MNHEHIATLVRQALDVYKTKQSTDSKLKELDYEPLSERDRRLVEATNDLKRAFETKWDKLTELQTRYVQEFPPQEQTSAPSTDMLRIQLLQAEIKRLKAEIEVEANDLLKVDRPSEEVIRLNTKVRLVRSIEGYKHVLATLQKQGEQARVAIERERETLQECEEINSVLVGKLEQARMDAADGSHQNTILSELRAEMMEYRKRYGTLMRELISFVEEHYPPHPLESKKKRQTDDDEQEAPEKTSSLKDILQDIMNLAFSTPANPYLTLVDGEYWPPYVETLVRAGIAVRHPKDSHRIKMVEFHA